jgi:hypothetical protein
VLVPAVSGSAMAAALLLSAGVSSCK